MKEYDTLEMDNTQRDKNILKVFIVLLLTLSSTLREGSFLT